MNALNTMNVTNTLAAFARHAFRAAVLAAALGPVARAADDVVKEKEESAPAPAQGGGLNVPFGAQGRVIIMPGLRLQVGGQGQVQVQGNVRGPAAGAVAAEAGPKQPYLGVVAGVVAPSVRAQLDLPEGVGLAIEAVAAGGPAEKAGVKQFDVIHKFNDQVVCSPDQLTTLVKVAGAGTKVPLTLLRGGREKVVEAVLEERVGGDGLADEVVAGAMPGVLNLQDALPPGLQGRIPAPMQADIERKVAEALARAGAGGLVPGLVPGGVAPGAVPGIVPGMPMVQTQVLTIGPNAQSATVVSDGRGTVEIRSAGGKKTVAVKDPDGKEVYSGPLDSDEDLEKVPEDYRDWVREVDGDGPAVQVFEQGVEEPESEPAGESARPTI